MTEESPAKPQAEFRDRAQESHPEQLEHSRSSSKASPIGPSDKRLDKLDETTRAANEIIERERAERDAKTARLKKARLKRDAENAKGGDPATTEG